MTDLYLKVAHSSLGQSLFQALNLPNPSALKRSPDSSLAFEAGRYLLAGSTNAFCLSSAVNLLADKTADSEATAFSIDFFESATANFCKRPKTVTKQAKLQNVSKIEQDTYNAILFDASGCKDLEALSEVYGFFHAALRGIKENGKILLLAQDYQQIQDPQSASMQAALLGFCKSVAKETGKKGITCNIVFVQKGAQKYLATSMAFFLSSKSAFVSGQSVRLTNHSQTTGKSVETQPLKNKTALVTGAAQGIGRETALTLARDGATVICLDIPQNEKLITELARQINGHSLAINLLDEDAVKVLCQKLSSQVGVVDIVVHNAGITRDKTLAKMPKDYWDQVITLNFERVVKINQSLIEQDILNDQARIVCISSIAGIAGNFGQTNYACSKAGVAAYVEALAKASGSKSKVGFTINAIAPGFIETKMTDAIPFLTREIGRRLNALSQGGLPLDIAEAISYFCHPESHSLNGNVLRVCGLSLMGK